MGLGETDTRAKLIDPVLHQRGWTEDCLKREETPGAIQIIDGEAERAREGLIIPCEWPSVATANP
ncbi:hypothetical protein [Microcystis panniformis]|uniref:Type I restriction-modification system restriction subunit R n=1 Tax=Microcystis panniformis FACHB-1757 TaxID=1638788 RepID=A0A0K1S583_9CHRO|nr:hypothetical protein [Microcystis panniformis]AKV69136.1 Type I restriction-modification system restriction subunit R [Microcystis panniformis FACHB-1757]